MAELNMSNAQKLLKKQYGAGALNTYDIGTPLLSQVKKTFNLEGEQFEDYIPLSMGGGRGTTQTGVLPTANKWKMDRAYFDSIENLSVVKLKRTLMYATKGEGAWVDAQAELVKRGVLLFRNNTERQLMGDGTGKLGTIQAATVPSTVDGITFTCDLDPVTFVEANFEEGDIVNVGTGDTSQFEVIELQSDDQNEYADPKVILTRLNGSKVPAASDAIFMQGSENNDIQGLRGVLSATAGSIYGVPVQRRWRAYNLLSYGKGISLNLLDQMCFGVHRKVGEAPNLIVLGHTQYRILKATLEGLKRYESTTILPRFNMPVVQGNLMKEAAAGRLGFKAMVYDSPFGSMPVVISRFARRDEVFMINTERMELKHMRGFGWHDEDGTVFLREAGKTNYEARYGGDMEAWIPPPYHAYANGLTYV